MASELQSSRSRSFEKLIKSKVFRYFLVVLLLAGAFFATYKAGQNSQSSKTDTSKSTSSKTESNNDRWTSLGNVESINGESITVVDSRDRKKTAVISKDTRITDRQLKDIKVDAVKVGQKVIVQGTQAKDGKLTATRIRVRE